MEPLERIRTLIRAGDPDGTVTLRWLAALIGERLDDGEPEEEQPAGDLTVDEVAAHFQRSPSTVRGWCSRGELRAYKLNRRDWRIPRPAIREYEEAQREPEPVDDEHVDIAEWRKAS